MNPNAKCSDSLSNRPKRSHIEESILVSIERLGIQGEGVGYYSGQTVFIQGALPGEVVEASIYEKRKNYARAKIIKFLKISPDRQQPICPYFGVCGGCQLMHLKYEMQLEAKRKRIVDALERIGKLSDFEVLPCVASPSPLSYRNKIQLPVIQGPIDFKMGLYSYQSHDLVEITHCPIHCAFGEEALKGIREILKKSKIKAYNFKTKEGQLRHVLIKSALYSEQILVVLVTSFKSNAFLQSVGNQILNLMPQIKGVVQNINHSSGNVILGLHYHTLAGVSSIEERLCNLNFKISAASFFQVNPAQAENLYEKALEFSEVTQEETVLDAYCGVGTLSLIFAKRAKFVIGVECVTEAIFDAKENAKRNGILNVEFFCAKAEEFISTLQKIDVAVINPPRKGCDQQFLDKLFFLNIKRLIYISCDPATLARDLAIITSQGYKIEKIQPFDMFPQTAHVETLVCLKKQI